MNLNLRELAPLLPGAILLVTGVLLLLYEVFANQRERSYFAHIAVVGFVIAIAVTWRDMSAPTALLFESDSRPASVIVDAFGRFSSMIFMIGGLLASLLSPAYARNAEHDHGEYYALIVFSVIGMMVMAMAGDLMTFFLGLETMSIAIYALTALRKGDARSSEAALKYFLMGAFASAFMLFGIALVYGATGSVYLSDLAVHLGGQDSLLAQPLLEVGLLLVLVGFAFKVAAVPFHMWAPDVYEGAPTPISAFMAVGVKAAAFAGLLRVVLVGFSADQAADASWVSLLAALAVLTVLVGNVLALVQKTIKRMLAYSSVAHAGYALIGVVAACHGETSAAVAVIFYLASYTFMTVGAFGVLAYLERKDGGMEAERYGAYAGVGYKHPAIGLAMSLFMLALAGLPLTGGFFGKLYLFSAAIRADQTPLAFVGIAGSIISVYYYLRVIVAFYMKEVPDPGPTPAATRSVQLGVGLALSALFVLLLGVLPGPFIELSWAAIRSLG